MTVPSVTFTGTEVVLVAGLIARSLRVLQPDDREVCELLLDRALAALPWQVSPDIMVEINRLRGTDG